MAPFGLTLGQAAKETGLGKSTIARAVKSGRLSAARQEDGSYRIDPSELFRVFPPGTPGTDTVEHHATLPAALPVHPVHPLQDPETLARLAALEAEVRGLRELLAEVRSSRDTERDQHRMFMAALPKPAAEPEPVRQPWWRRLAG